ncbi:penicillin-binding protein, beta-lactamase class C [Nostoc sp. PCC 7524]|uniref:serine hydrolase n=1 Tax=Nostoc sp. (strain ATCC 29411 / PCC 7524) TaxID=28072 RepID=UPI00029F2775|nr:serine hydrolase [Nostoc sp. PCC 7524]AFY46293.1 penicillin-binding protein, beta-lactamase class C [Nostoc sp. PCC 7524]
MVRITRLISWVIIGIILVSLPNVSSWARNVPQLPPTTPQQQQPTQLKQPVVPSATARGLNDPQELEAFTDSIFNEEMPKSHIPGAVISVVKDGKLFFAKGYGYANAEKKIPVVADQTLFRVASLSKLFTATAAMQLYEQGRLDLGADVNQYLTTFQLQNPYPESVRVAQLMTHTDGTTKRRIGLAARTAAQMQPLGKYLANYMPPVVRQPGRVYDYSSHSTTLLGYLVERVSGIPFTQYITDNILQPLKMRQSTFLQPPPPDLAENLAVGYQYRNGKLQAVPYLYFNIAPAAAMSATATDMAHFMIAHLMNGRYENSQILKAETVQLMHQQHFTHHPKLPGTGYGFRERLENNMRMTGHLGSLRGYSSSLTLMRDRNIGIFIATNSINGVHGKFLSRFLDHYFPVTQQPEPLPSLKLSQKQLNHFTGTYRDLEYPRHTFVKLTAPFEHMNIFKNDDGTLQIRTPSFFFRGDAPSFRLLPVEPLLFKRTEDDAFTAFGEDSNGQIAFAFNPLWPKIGAYERIPWYETIGVQLAIAGFCVFVFFSASLMWLVRPLIDFLKGKPFLDRQKFNPAWMIAGLISTLNLVFLIGLPLSLWLIGAWKLVYGVPAVVVALFCLPLVTTPLTIVLALLTVLAWRNKNWSLGVRSHYSLVTFAASIFIPFVMYWNLLGFQF